MSSFLGGGPHSLALKKAFYIIAKGYRQLFFLFSTVNFHERCSSLRCSLNISILAFFGHKKRFMDDGFVLWPKNANIDVLYLEGFPVNYIPQ